MNNKSVNVIFLGAGLTALGGIREIGDPPGVVEVEVRDDDVSDVAGLVSETADLVEGRGGG